MGEGHGLNVVRRSGCDREGMMVGLAMVGGAFVCVYIVGWRLGGYHHHLASLFELSIKLVSVWGLGINPLVPNTLLDVGNNELHKLATQHAHGAAIAQPRMQPHGRGSAALDFFLVQHATGLYLEQPGHFRFVGGTRHVDSIH